MNTIDLIRLWMLSLSIPIQLLENQRVKWELEQKPIDAIGLLKAFKRSIYEVDGNIIESANNLDNPRYQLELIQIIR